MTNSFDSWQGLRGTYQQSADSRRKGRETCPQDATMPITTEHHTTAVIPPAVSLQSQPNRTFAIHPVEPDLPPSLILPHALSSTTFSPNRHHHHPSSQTPSPDCHSRHNARSSCNPDKTTGKPPDSLHACPFRPTRGSRDGTVDHRHRIGSFPDRPGSRA